MNSVQVHVNHCRQYATVKCVTSAICDQRVPRCAKILDDAILYAKLQQGDMIA